MFRRARLSVKPNVRPGIGARGSTAPNPQRGQDSPRPPEPAADSALKSIEPTDVPTVDFGRPESKEKPSRSSSDEKTGDGKDVEESSKSSCIVSHKRKRMPSTSSLVKPSVSIPSESHPLSTVNQETPQPNPSPTKEKQPCSDRYRIYKAQKLREMLKEELRKEKKQWKNKCAISESQKPRDRSKMTMRDLIYYLPDNNPMTSSLEQEKKVEKSLPAVQTREASGFKSNPGLPNNNDSCNPLWPGPGLNPPPLVYGAGALPTEPQVLPLAIFLKKGQIIIKWSEPIFQIINNVLTQIGLYNKSFYSSKSFIFTETDMFFLAISMVGTDFSMIGQLFPHRARIEIKNKFKREEKTNGWRIDKAFQEKRPFDFDFFAHLLQKVLAEEEKRKQKSTKHHTLKEKKSSKPRKNVKVKKVACEEVNNDPDESVSAIISDSERSPKDTQPAEEEEEPLTLSGQDSEQVALNQKKRRSKNQEEANEQEINSASGNATVHSNPSEGEELQTECQSLKPEVNEDECNKKQKLSCVQNIDDNASLASSEKVEKITDPILSSSNHQGAMSVATESSELSTSDLPSLELGIRELCKVNNADSSCPEERNIDLKNTSLETDQTENVKPVLRGRLQRPKPNLSRAIVKKSVLSKGKTDSESKNSHPEASVDKNQMEKDKMNSSDSSGMENTERENPEAKTPSNLSEKNYLQEDNQPKALRSARVMRGRLQRLKPNVGKAAEKKEIFASQEKIEANVDKNENESCTNRDISQQMEDQLCKNIECEDVTSQPAKKDSSQGVQLEEPKVLNECIKIKLEKEVQTSNSILLDKYTGYTKVAYKSPYIGKMGNGSEICWVSNGTVASRGDGAESICSRSTAVSSQQSRLKMREGRLQPPRKLDNGTTRRERGKSQSHFLQRPFQPKILVDGLGLSAMLISPCKDNHRDIPLTGHFTTQNSPALLESQVLILDMILCLIALGKLIDLLNRLSLSISIQKLSGLKPDCIQEDNKAPPLKQVPIQRPRFQKPKPNIGREIGRRKISSKEVVSEEILVSGEGTAALRETVRLDTSLRQKVLVEINTAKEMESDLKETEKSDISPGEKIPEVVDVIMEVETGLKATERNISPRKKTPKVIDATEEIDTDLEERGRRKISPQENGPEEAKIIYEMETDLKETAREMPTRETMPELIGITAERQTDLEETERREITTWVKAPEEFKTIGEMEADFAEIQGKISQREKAIVEVSAIEEGEIDLKETGKKEISLMEKPSERMTVIEEMEADLEETRREISSRDRGSEEICVTKEMVADLEKTGKTDISSPRENEPEEAGTSRQTEPNLMQNNSGDCSATPSLDIKNISSEVLLVMHTSVEEKRNSEKDLPSHFKISSQTSEFDKTEDLVMQPPDVPEQFSDVNLSKSLPQEQKPLEVKPAPFVRSRFKRPTPNLARAASKRETVEAKKYVCGKKSETDKTETIVIQQNSEPTNTLPSQHDDPSLMAPREDDTSGQMEEETVILPCTQTEKDLSPSNACGPKEESLLTQAKEDDLVVSIGSHNINTFQEEVKESVIQSPHPIRGRLQRPRPNVRRAGQRQIAGKGETKGIIKEERTVLQKDEINNKDLIASDSQIGTEVEVTSSKVSECGMHENQNDMVLVESIHVNKVNNTLSRHGNEPYVSSPAPVIRRKFQKAKPNLGRAHGKKGKPDTGKGTADQSEASKPEDNLLQQGDSDTQLHLKEKVEFLSSLEVSARNDCIGSNESDLAPKHAELEEVGPLGRGGEKPVGDNCVTSVIEEPYLNKLTRLNSRPQPLKGSNSSKIASDQRTISNATECEIDHGEKRMHRKTKPNVTRGRGSKRIRSKTSKKEPRASKSTLVTLRASQEEDEDDAEDFESDYEEESYHLAPEEVNKAPVFVPIGLRSPEPVPAQIEETMEELEITVNVPDIGCMAVVEHPLSNTDVTTQEMKQEENLNVSSFEMTTGEYTQDEPEGANDGSTEAAITLLTMGDLLLQSEITTVQGDVGVCVLPHVHSEDKSHIPFSPDSVHHEILQECQEVSLPVISTFPASFEENKIISEEQSAREERGLMEKVKENATATRNTASKITNNLRMRSRFAKPKLNLEKILGTNRLDAHAEVPSLCITKGELPQPQRDTEKNASKTTELEDKSLGPVTVAENKEQSKLACVHDIKGTSISQEVNLTERNEDQEVGSQEVQILSVAPVVSSETAPHTLALGMVLAESSVEEPLRKDSEGDSVPEVKEWQCSPTSLPEVQQENIINPLDLTANLIPNVHQDGEDEQTFILTLVEIPANAVEDFTDTAAQLMPNTLLPAPILVKSVNAEQKGDMSICLPTTSVGQDAMCLFDSGKDGSENLPANLDITCRKRFHCRLDKSDVPPAKKTSPISRDDCQEYTSEVCSNELINIFEEREGEPYKRQSIFPTSGSTHTTPEPQNKQDESSFQSVGSRSLDKIIDTHTEKNMPHLPQDEIIMSDKEERTDAASKTEQKDNRIPSSKAPLSRPGRRPLGFLSLICSKSSLESDEPTQVHSKKRLRPLIPVSRQKLKRSNPFSESQKKNQESSDLLPSPSVINNHSENIGCLATQVSSGQPSLKEACKSGQKRRREEEPTTVSEYFFSDIFIEVDEKE
uniref:BDP1ral transcription factor IIIB subunit n=1 Tax=Otolemur garnettii TaxID=30611 RepID=H0WZQ3_OTOGA